ncbi:MAG: XTP/dITP diphosphatase [Clostridiales bacterium]|nr:XTP/dITP diphosphatase [Clostridiales bacterium]
MVEKIIFATGNQGKLKEIRMILKDLPVEIVSMKEAGIDINIDENGSTFEENAVIKAKAIMEKTGCLVLADDSGLEVDYMDKAPGIYSARFLGEDTSYDVKNNYILDRLKGVPDELRTARFVCAVAAVFPDGKTVTRRGTIEGIIGHQTAGSNGFGYDPIFYVPEFNCTTAQLDPEQKNAVSHRGKALRAIGEVIREYLQASAV